MPAELVLETSPRGAGIRLSQALEGSAVLEKSGSATCGARVSRDGGFHAPSIGAPRGTCNPWRE